MKYKKYTYILLLILTLTIGINKTYAAGPDSDDFCYYLSPSDAQTDLRVIVKLKYGANAVSTNDMRVGSSMITIIKYKDIMKDSKTPMLNWSGHFTKGSGMFDILGLHNNGSSNSTTNGTSFEMYYPSLNPSVQDKDSLANETNPECPKYIVIELNTTGFDEYFGWGTESEMLASEAVKSSGGNAEYAYASNFRNGKQITRDVFFGALEIDGLIGRDESVAEYTCEALSEDLFGTKAAPTKLRYYVEMGMQYIRIIVPILIIALGMLDLGKAVIAGKEDEMKKAQVAFIKRLIAGVIVFFIPALVDIIMYLANIVWDGNYTSCNLL